MAVFGIRPQSHPSILLDNQLTEKKRIKQNRLIFGQYSDKALQAQHENKK